MESGRRRSIHQVQVARAVQLAEGYQVINCTVEFFVWPNVPGLDPVIKGKIMQWQIRTSGALPAPNQLARSRRQLLLRHRRSAYADFDAYASVRNMHNGRKDLGEEYSDEDSDEE